MNHIFTENQISLINQLTEALFSLFPSSYAIIKTQKDFDNLKYYWARALLASNILDEQDSESQIIKIRRGIHKACILNEAFMPSCGQFIALCNEE